MLRIIVLGLLIAWALPSHAVTITFEKPGQPTTRAAFDASGVKGFDGRLTGHGQNFTTGFGGSGVVTGSDATARNDWPIPSDNESGDHTAGVHRSLSVRDMGPTLTAGASVPEPATWAMLVVGFSMVGWAMRRRNRLPSVLS